MDIYRFGYPEQCDRCKNFPYIKPKLPRPYHNDVTGSKKVMLIGQDPYIHKDPERVKCVLMLDEEHGQLRQWLKEVMGKNIFDRVEVYATNIVKCPVERDSPTSPKGILSLLQPCFNNCKHYLIEEIGNFKPAIVLTLGEPAHKLFVSVLDNNDMFEDSMKKAFTGKFIKASVRTASFQYSPCLHIKTYRIADTYGKPVEKFRCNLQNILIE